MLSWKSRQPHHKSPPKHEIEETDEFRSILKKCSYNSFLLLDLDQTVVESKHELGGDPWFAKLCEHAPKVIADRSDAIHSAVKLYHLVQQHTQMKLIENDTARIIRLLQDIHIPIIAVTSRGQAILQPTLQQLKGVGIDLSRNWEMLPELVTLDGNGDDERIELSHGIVFCNGRNKDEGLEAFFHYLKRYERDFPEHVIMADDRRKHLDAGSKAAAAHGSDFTGLRYNRLDKKSAAIDMDKAGEQLDQLSQHFTDTQRELLTKLQFPVKRKGTDELAQPEPKRLASAETMALQRHSLFTTDQLAKSDASRATAEKTTTLRGSH